jgi:hypothetical protein
MRVVPVIVAAALALLALATGCGISPSRPDAAVASPAPPLSIDVLDDAAARELEECGCAFRPRGQESEDSNPVIGWIDTDAPLRLDGATQRLVLRGQHEDPAREQPVVGDRAEFRFDNDRTRATLACRVKATCWEDESCEGIAYDCDLEVESGGRRGTRAVEGYCGC